MKKTLLLLSILFAIEISFASQYAPTNIHYPTNQFTIEHPIKNNATNTGNYWGLFFLIFAIAAIGTYQIWGIGAGIVAVGITYFAVNANKRAMKMAIWGCVAGMIVGGVIRLLILL